MKLVWSCELVFECVRVCVRDESSHSGRRTGSSGWRHAHQEQNWFGWKQPHLRVRRWIGSCLRTLLQYYCSNQNCNIRNEIQTAMKCYKNIFTSIRTMQKHFFWRNQTIQKSVTVKDKHPMIVWSTTRNTKRKLQTEKLDLLHTKLSAGLQKQVQGNSSFSPSMSYAVQQATKDKLWHLY